MKTIFEYKQLQYMGGKGMYIEKTNTGKTPSNDRRGV